MDSSILKLLTAQTFGILSVFESYQLSHLKACKHTLLSHDILTWKLKSRVDWLNEGDANTKFFHSYASARITSNSIWGLQNHHGTLIEDDD